MVRNSPFERLKITSDQLIGGLLMLASFLNGHRLTSLTLTEPGQKSYSVVMPRNFLNTRNVLLFSLPNAISPNSLNMGDDARVLGISIEWIEFLKQGTSEN